MARSMRATLLAAFATGIVVAACNPSAPTVVPAVASPSPSASSPPRATPTPTGDPGALAVEAFVDRVTKDGFSYQATFTGQSRHSASILPISKGLLQVSGDNVLVRATFKFESGYRAVAEHRLVNGKAWLREDVTLGWKQVTLKPADSMAAFASVHSASDVKIIEPVKADGKTLYRIELRSAIVNPLMIPAVNLSDEALTKPTLSLLIDEDGRPVRGTAEINGKGRISGQLQEIVIDLTVTFTKVGQAVTIKAP